MKTTSAKGLALRAEVRERILQLHPALRPRTIPSVDCTSIVLGRDTAEAPVSLSVRARLEHMHVVGTTGGGKTRLIQHCACQDIKQGRGVCIVDPHGNHPDSLYRSMIAWIAQHRIAERRVVHLIDPNAGSHITGFNPLALPSEEYDPPVIAEAMQQALERIWGEEDMNTKPTMQRVLAAILTTLVELRMTLAEARLFFDPHDRDGVRAWAMHALKNEEARDELAWLHGIASDIRGQQDFRQEITGPRNRLVKLTNNEAIKLGVSQDTNGIDFRAALDEGHIILANLSPGPRAGDIAVQLLGRLLTRSIFFHTVRRKRTDHPFFLFLDECQLYLSGDISRMLAEARKYGTGVVLAHQTLAQLRVAGEDMLDAIKSTTNIKVVARVKDPAEAAELSDMVFRHNLEMPVNILTKLTIVGHELVRRKAESESWQEAISNSAARTMAKSMTESEAITESVSDAVNESIGTAENENWGTSDSSSTAATDTDAFGTSTTINLVPGDILSMPAAASGNTIGETAGTHSNMGLASPSRYLIGNARLEPAVVAGVGVGESRQRSIGKSDSSQSGTSRSSGISTTKQRGTSSAKGSAWTRGVSYSTSESSTEGSSRSHGLGGSRGWSEVLEPVLADRPASVHSLDNVRYMAAEVLRNFPTGFAAVSLVDGTGLKTAVLKVARVADCKLTSEQFHRLRREILQRSPSAVPIETALASLATRQSRILQRASQLRDAEPEAPPTVPDEAEAQRTRKVRRCAW